MTNRTRCVRLSARTVTARTASLVIEKSHRTPTEEKHPVPRPGVLNLFLEVCALSGVAASERVTMPEHTTLT